MLKFELEGHEYVALCDLLKTMGMCENGAQAKSVIAKGQVKVDGETELRKRCKIRSGQIIEFNEERVEVV